MPFAKGKPNITSPIETWIATFEEKLLRKISGLSQEVLYEIFMDIHKAYDAQDREQTLKIVEGYGLGHHVLRLMAWYLEKEIMAERASGYYGASLQGSCGVSQGDPIYPGIFNIVTNAIDRN